MRVDLFDFDLSPDLIASHPIEPRDGARMLVVGDMLEDRVVRDLPGLLRAGDVLVVNDTRVIPARLLGLRGEVAIEVTLHRAATGDPYAPDWLAFARPGKRLRLGDRIVFAEHFSADLEEKRDGGEIALRFNCSGEALRAALDRYGAMPLPPYIKRDSAAADRHDYQTMFAAHDGAVAAPTAGLHLTPGLIDSLAAAGISVERLTLHVGAGTFLPVKAEDTDDHVMHAETGYLDAACAARLNAVRARGGRIVATGTTSLRLLESAADDAGILHPFAGDTRLFITPGYRFKAVDLLMTNFHLPRSTLFMLVCAFAGTERMRSAYAHAMAARYRFYSYGDASLLHRADAA